KGPVTSVDVSTDGGRTWKPADLDPRKTQFGWRLWGFSFRPDRESYYNVMARATDASGDKQPFTQEWNPSGYGWNVVQRVGINVLENPPQSALPTLQPVVASNQPAEYKAACITCHQEDVIRQ